MLQFITHHTERYDEVSAAEAVLRGGCRWIQLRMKDAPSQAVVEAGRAIGDMCRKAGATFILDDRADLVDELQADGVHLGKNDMPVEQARGLLGDDRIIGATANTFDDIRRAAAAGADYIGLGPFRFTTTKRNLSPVIGIDGYRSLGNIGQRNIESVHTILRQEGIRLPIVAIGGIVARDIEAIMSTGIDGIALSGALLQAADTTEETQKIISIINRYKQ